MLEFHHSDFLHAQVEKSIQCILGLEPIDLLQPSQQAPASVGQESTDGSQAEKEQPVSFLHPLLTHLSRFEGQAKKVLQTGSSQRFFSV